MGEIFMILLGFLSAVMFAGMAIYYEFKLTRQTIKNNDEMMES